MKSHNYIAQKSHETS